MITITGLSSIEPFVMNVVAIDTFYAHEEWARLRRPGAVEFVQRRLTALASSLGDKPFLDGERCTARPAYQRALQAQLRDFQERGVMQSQPGSRLSLASS